LLEQYRTPPEIAIEIASWIRSLGCRVAIDLGAGTGMIAYALSLLGTYTVAIEIDIDALNDAASSALRPVALTDFVQADVEYLPLRETIQSLCVAENPPFGMYRRGIDTLFLRAAARLGAEYIASIHHGGSDKTLKYLREFMRERGYGLKHIERFKFPIPATHRSHIRHIYYVPALLLLFEKRVRET